jgi:hypothetical protein
LEKLPECCIGWESLSRRGVVQGEVAAHYIMIMMIIMIIMMIIMIFLFSCELQQALY